MSSKKINVVIERGIDGSFSAYIADDNCEFGCIGEGKSVEETKADFMKAVGEMQEVYAEEGSKFPDVEFDFIYDMASFLNYYAYAFSLAGLARITGVNQGQLSHYIHIAHSKQLKKMANLAEGFAIPYLFSRKLNLTNLICKIMQ